jgi:hypothetical protein
MVGLGARVLVPEMEGEGLMYWYLRWRESVLVYWYLRWK